MRALAFFLVMLGIVVGDVAGSVVTGDGLYACGNNGTYKFFGGSVVGASCAQYLPGSMGMIGLPPCANNECSSPLGNVFFAIFVPSLGLSGMLVVGGDFEVVFVANAGGPSLLPAKQVAFYDPGLQAWSTVPCLSNPSNGPDVPFKTMAHVSGCE
jgi:hypothetical protein